MNLQKGQHTLEAAGAMGRVSMWWDTLKFSVLNSLPAGKTLDFDDIFERLVADVNQVEGDAEDTPAAESAQNVEAIQVRQVVRVPPIAHSQHGQMQDNCSAEGGFEEGQGEGEAQAGKAHQRVSAFAESFPPAVGTLR
ncbi:hypothetical protein B0H11DRAFT_2227229 [Mycena galericulata]|nr:hypothetical protein B0H11DRAFT_2227229 [Mycena galericulata]